jgi:hypothetical protein
MNAAIIHLKRERAGVLETASAADHGRDSLNDGRIAAANPASLVQACLLLEAWRIAAANPASLVQACLLLEACGILYPKNLQLEDQYE